MCSIEEKLCEKNGEIKYVAENLPEQNEETFRKKSPLHYFPVPEEHTEKLTAMFPCLSLLEVHPGGFVATDKYKEYYADRILNMEVRQDDIWVVSCPRTGSTWTQEIVWCIGNDLNFQEAKAIQLARVHNLELSTWLPTRYENVLGWIGDSVHVVEMAESPRYIKTHLPFHLLPQQIQTVKPKIIYIARNPKDMCVSFYYLSLIFNHRLDFNDFCEMFMKGKVISGPFPAHILEFWRRRHEPNILFLKYEDIKVDLEGTILKIAKFMDKSLSAEDVKRLAEYVSFKSMKGNPAVNLEPLLEMVNGPDFIHNTNFIRKGKTGDWRNHMSDEMAAKFDAWIEESFSGTGLSF